MSDGKLYFGIYASRTIAPNTDAIVQVDGREKTNKNKWGDAADAKVGSRSGFANYTLHDLPDEPAVVECFQYP